jgi:hypothetical protein
MSRIKKALWGLLLLIILCGSFYAGGIIGFNRGYAYSVFSRSPTEAYLTLSALESVNSGDIIAVKKQLESQLDTHIIEHWSGLSNKPVTLFNMLPYDAKSVNKLMSKVAAYRAQQPSTSDDPIIKECINDVIGRYSNK